jgi:hypothetical protein
MPMEKTKLGRLVTGRPYDVLARVSAAGNRVRIHLEANQTPVFDWEGPLADAQNGMNFFTNDRRYVGFGACAGAYRVERFEVRMVSGAGQITRTDQAPPAKAPEAQRELTGSPDAPWVNLFDGLSAAAGVVDGSWGWSGGIQVVSLLAGQADGKAGRFALPVWPKGDYELRLRFARTDGDGGLVVLLPVPGAGTQTAAFVDGYRAFPAAGISKVGEPLRASLESRLKNHTMHTLVVRVTEGAGQTTIQAEMNGTRVVRWQGPPAGAPPAAGWSLADPGRLGLGVPGNCQFVLPTVEFRPLSGTAVWKPQKAADFKP